MAEFKDAIPVNKFSPPFTEIRENVRARTVPEFLRNEHEKVPGVCMFIWDEMVHQGITREPFKIAPVIHDGYAGIHEFVRAELGRDPITEAYATEFFNEIDLKTPFAEVAVVKCFPNDIHIVDVEFSDNRKPLPHQDPTREYRSHRGLHVFDTFLERLKTVARAKGAERISLMVASPRCITSLLDTDFGSAIPRWRKSPPKPRVMATQWFSLFPAKPTGGFIRKFWDKAMVRPERHHSHKKRTDTFNPIVEDSSPRTFAMPD